MLVYGPKHVDFGLASENIQEWLPSLILLIWSFPLAMLIQKKGGLRWYRNRYYGFLPLIEVIEFSTRLLPQDYEIQLAGVADLILLVTFILCENKLVGEYTEVKNLQKMIERVQEESTVVAFLNKKYPPDARVRSRKERRRQESQLQSLTSLFSEFGQSLTSGNFFTGTEDSLERTSSSTEALHASVMRLKRENVAMRKALKVNFIPDSAWKPRDSEEEEDQLESPGSSGELDPYDRLQGGINLGAKSGPLPEVGARVRVETPNA